MTLPIDKTRPWRQENWDWRAACNFILGGTGTGLLVAAALALVPSGVFRASAIVAMALVAAGLFSVWMEIGRPFRAANVVLHPRTSWMTRESLIAPLVFLGAIAVLLDEADSWRWPAAAAALAFLYCQARMVGASKGIPAWRHRLVVPLLLVSGLAEGTGALILVVLIGGGVSQWAGGALLVLVVARWLIWDRYRDALHRRGAPQKALSVLNEFAPHFGALGAIIPAVFLLAAEVAGGVWFPALGALFAIGGGWWLKLILMTRAGYNQGFALPHLPARGSGSAGPAAKPGWSPAAGHNSP